MENANNETGYNGVVPRVPVKKVYFLKDGDHNSKPVFMAIKPKDYRAGIESLEDELTEQCQLPTAARSIYTSHGRHAVKSLEDLSDGSYYVVSTKGKAKGVDLAQVNESQSKKWMVTGKSSEASFNFNPPPSEPRSAWASPTSSKYSSDLESGYSSSTRDSKGRPKKLYLFRNGNTKICHTMLLNSRTAMSFEQVKQDMNDIFHMNINKIYTPQGEIVSESLFFFPLSCMMSVCIWDIGAKQNTWQFLQSRDNQNFAKSWKTHTCWRDVVVFVKQFQRQSAVGTRNSGILANGQIQCGIGAENRLADKKEILRTCFVEHTQSNFPKLSSFSSDW